MLEGFCALPGKGATDACVKWASSPHDHMGGQL